MLGNLKPFCCKNNKQNKTKACKRVDLKAKKVGFCLPFAGGKSEPPPEPTGFPDPMLRQSGRVSCTGTQSDQPLRL